MYLENKLSNITPAHSDQYQEICNEKSEKGITKNGSGNISFRTIFGFYIFHLEVVFHARLSSIKLFPLHFTGNYDMH